MLNYVDLRRNVMENKSVSVVLEQIKRDIYADGCCFIINCPDYDNALDLIFTGSDCFGVPDRLRISTYNLILQLHCNKIPRDDSNLKLNIDPSAKYTICKMAPDSFRGFLQVTSDQQTLENYDNFIKYYLGEHYE